uniref:Uncharacterized protein n=1 Tax=Anguilla anguilla TaxID=7936 RepID=A0A0E9RVJ5_ANGAN
MASKCKGKLFLCFFLWLKVQLLGVNLSHKRFLPNLKGVHNVMSLLLCQPKARPYCGVSLHRL